MMLGICEPTAETQWYHLTRLIPTSSMSYTGGWYSPGLVTKYTCSLSEGQSRMLDKNYVVLEKLSTLASACSTADQHVPT